MKWSKSLYGRWTGMRDRCRNPRSAGWRNYGGRGITVCDRWKVFENFASDMGEPGPGQWLDRRDVNGNYCPENCRWVDDMENGKNQRKTRYLTINGETHHLAEWTRKTGIDGGTIMWRKNHGKTDAEILDPNLPKKTTKGRTGGPGRQSRASAEERAKKVREALNL